MRISKGAQARAAKPEPLQKRKTTVGENGIRLIDPGVREVRHSLPREANRAGLRAIDRIFSGRWPGHTGAAVRNAVIKRLQEDQEMRAKVDALIEKQKQESV